MYDEFNFNELKAADRLPSPPSTVLAIMQLMQRENASVALIAQLIQSDPALTGRVLKLANSSAFATRRPIVDIQNAIVMLGMQRVCNLALSISLIGKYQEGRCQSFNYPAYWSEALAIAVAIASLTTRERTAPNEEAFALGLLSDIGRLALATAWPEKYSECLESAQGDRLIILEQECFAINHRSVSLMLLADWGFPEVFRNALMQSFIPKVDDLSRTARLAGQLAFARKIARYCMADENYHAVLFQDLVAEARNHNLDEAALLVFIEECVAKWQDWGKLTDINTEIHYSFPEAAPAKKLIFKDLDVLLVDDEPIMLAHLSEQMTALGHRVKICHDGESALKHIIEHKPQLVISEWSMKPIDGLQLCKMSRTFEFGKNLYFILLTAAETDDALVEAFDAGIDDYVTKPVNLRILLARIRAAQRLIALQMDLVQERKEIEISSSELAIANRRLEQMANTDLLTHLPNRRYAMTRLEQEWLMAEQFNCPLSVLMLDLDHFKSINDLLGHDIGDQTLAHAAKVMRETIRASDVACRLGGEEFLVIAPNTDGAAGLLLADRIRKAIESRQLKDVAFSRPLTVSIGVACSTNHNHGWRELVKLADQAVYRVKDRGRNGVEFAS